MKTKILCIFSLTLLFFSYCSAQSADECQFVSEYINSKKTKKTKIILVKEVYSTFLISESRRSELYAKFDGLCIKPVVDSLLLISKKQSANFNWDEKCVKEISIMLADSAFEIQKTNSLANGTKKRNKTEVAIFKTSSPIYLNKNEFLILISESRGETNGSNCLFSYELKNGKWTQKRLIYCFYS